jgi:hypothetical protein
VAILLLVLLALLAVVFRNPTADGDHDDPIDELLRELDMKLPTGQVVFQSDPAFGEASEIWNRRVGPPRAVIDCSSEDDVVVAVPYVATMYRDHNVPFRIRSGGHSYMGLSGVDGGIVLSLRNVNAVHVDMSTGIITVGPGATVQQVSPGGLCRCFASVCRS